MTRLTHKACGHCKATLSIDSFQKDRQTATGYASYCRSCKAKRMREYNQRPEVKARQAERQRESYANNTAGRRDYIRRHNARPDVRAERRESWERWRATEHGRSWQRQYERSRRAQNLAREAVRKALRNNVLVRPDRCGQCNAKGRVEAHHHKGYGAERRLDVQWLCKTCHTAAT